MNSKAIVIGALGIGALAFLLLKGKSSSDGGGQDPLLWDVIKKPSTGEITYVTKENYISGWQPYGWIIIGYLDPNTGKTYPL